jgi:hypothetical protein
MKTQDRIVTIQLHKSDFNPEIWESLRKNTYWYDIVFIGERIIRIVTWESNYESIQEIYNFN